MTRVDTPGAGSDTGSVRGAVQQGGKVDAIHADASKLVIGGVTYSYNPLTTVVMVNGKRSTISNLRIGDAVQFQAALQGAHQPELLTYISMQRR